MTELELAKIRLTEAQRALAIVRTSQAGELSQRYAESHVLPRCRGSGMRRNGKLKIEQ